MPMANDASTGSEPKGWLRAPHATHQNAGPALAIFPLRSRQLFLWSTFASLPFTLRLFFCLPLFVRRAHANSHEVSEGICALCLDEPTFLFASTLAFYRTVLIIIYNFYIHHQTFLSNRCFKFVFAVRLGMKIKYFRNDNKSTICLKT